MKRYNHWVVITDRKITKAEHVVLKRKMYLQRFKFKLMMMRLRRVEQVNDN